MILYYHNYFNDSIMIYWDITLMKYLLITSEIENELNFHNILSYTNIDSSNDYFIIKRIKLWWKQWIINIKYNKWKI